MKNVLQTIHITMILFLFCITFDLSAQSLEVSTYLSQDTYAQNDTIRVALRIKIPRGYHLYGNPLGPGIGKPTTLIPEEVTGIQWTHARAEKTKKYIPKDMTDLWVWAWEKEVYLFLEGIVTESAHTSINTNIILDALICKEMCLPANISVPLHITIGEKSGKAPFHNQKRIARIFATTQEFPLGNSAEIHDSASNTVAFFGKSEFPLLLPENDSSTVVPFEQNESSLPVQEEIPEKWRYTSQESLEEMNIYLALILAFIAGLILNFMPCVLPVLGIKILAFSKNRTESKRTAVLHSLAFSAGMIFVFLVLASFAAFAGMSWGEQFQQPIFIVILTILMFIFSLGMFDYFIILLPNSLAKLDMKQDNSAMGGNFLKGIFATILATPCSGPFLGATLAWTLTQPKIIIYLVFFSLGCGMASPYILLSASRRLARIIPKPGAWMQDFKHILGFGLIGFALYLMAGLPTTLVLPTVSMIFFLTAGISIYTRFAPFGSSILRKICAGLFVLLFLWGGYYISFVVQYQNVSEDNVSNIENNADVTWKPFSIAELEKAHAENKPVLIDFTARWCMNCQYNKINVYYSKEVEALIKEKNIIALRADLTHPNPIAESLRDRLGSRSVPFLAIFDGDPTKDVQVMRDLVSKKELIKVLEQLP